MHRNVGRGKNTKFYQCRVEPQDVTELPGIYPGADRIQVLAEYGGAGGDQFQRDRERPFKLWKRGGERVKAEFVCEACGYHRTIAVNSARNIERIAAVEAGEIR